MWWPLGLQGKLWQCNGKRDVDNSISHICNAVFIVEWTMVMPRHARL